MMTRISLRARMCMLLLLLSALPLAAQAGGSGSGQAERMRQLYPQALSSNLIADGCASGMVPVKNIHDPANPFVAEYSEWDYWLWANGRELTSAERIEWNRSLSPEGWQLLSAEVDDAGYPIPLEQTLKTTLALIAEDPEAFGERCLNTFSAYAPMPEAMQRELRLRMAQIEAPFRTAIPQWLADNPPQSAIVLPDGRVVTQGELGSAASGAGATEREGSRLYGTEGELLASIGAGEPWWHLTFADHAAATAGLGSGELRFFFSGGMVFVRDAVSSEQLAVFSFDGQRLPDDTSPYSGNINHWQPIPAASLPLIYAAQQERD